ncbi:MAG: winged helix-turn-helix transcriptional regulator [Fimbriimonadaceae bacterium]|nr:winged helix-turn-helix transcriptional regulator [Fimbriimonadaceae bacterium]
MPQRTYGDRHAPDQGEALRRFKADLFQVLAHPTRIHIIECLRDGESSVSGLLERTGVEPANLSQHLALLKAKQLVAKRKEGNQVFYSLRDLLLVELLESVRRYFHAHLEEAMLQFRQMEEANR